MRTGRPRVPLGARFWSKVQKTETCWLWTGYTAARGYGRLRMGGTRDPYTVAHRASWEIHNGAVPAGMKVLHRCDVRACVNPAHLFLGTDTDNMRDMVAKRRGLHGERSPHAKLTAAVLARARQLRASGWALRRIAALFGVSRPTITRALRGETWAHLSEGR